MRKSFKKGIAVLTVGAIALGMTACGASTDTAEESSKPSAKLDKEYIDMFKKAGKAVAGTEGSAIKNVITMQGTSVEYLDVFTTDGSYTEYYVSDTSILSDAEKGKLADSEQVEDTEDTEGTSEEDKETTEESTTGETDTSSTEGYVLSDWMTYTKDGKADKFYTVNTSYTGEDEGKEWYEFGEEMTELASGRTSFYVDLLSEGITEVVDRGTEKGSTDATGDVDVKIFTAKLDGEVISKMLSLQGSMQYADALSTIKSKGTKVDEAVLDEIKNYNDYFTSIWTVGDGEISWGIMDDEEGKLAFVDIVTGGAGVTLTLTKELIMGGIDLRDKPDFSSSEPYAEFIVKAIAENQQAEHEAHTQAEAEAEADANGAVVEGEAPEGTEEAPTEGETTESTVEGETVEDTVEADKESEGTETATDPTEPADTKETSDTTEKADTEEAGEPVEK